MGFRSLSISFAVVPGLRNKLREVVLGGDLADRIWLAVVSNSRWALRWSRWARDLADLIWWVGGARIWWVGGDLVGFAGFAVGCGWLVWVRRGA
uniref:Uncharacterized protein n=1 Tax=Fagus sylvatica TaxID=28930 RepID=A0A2N9GDP9_FAGSY